MRVLLAIFLFYWGWNKVTTYEGETAEEWYNRYRIQVSSKNQQAQEFEDQLSTFEDEITLKECIKSEDKFHENMFESACSNLKAEKNLNREQCALFLASNGAITALTKLKNESRQDCYKSYLENF